jgi:hypothetical protein
LPRLLTRNWANWFFCCTIRIATTSWRLFTRSE